MKKIAITSAVLLTAFLSQHAAAGEEEKAVVEAYVETVLNGRAFGRIEEFIAPDLVQHNPNLPNGVAPLKSFWEDFLGGMPEAQFESARMISEGQFVVDHAVFFPTVDSAGIAVVDIYRVEDGMIVQHWDVSMPIPDAFASGNHPVFSD